MSRFEEAARSVRGGVLAWGDERPHGDGERATDDVRSVHGCDGPRNDAFLRARRQEPAPNRFVAESSGTVVRAQENEPGAT